MHHEGNLPNHHSWLGELKCLYLDAGHLAPSLPSFTSRVSKCRGDGRRCPHNFIGHMHKMLTVNAQIWNKINKCLVSEQYVTFIIQTLIYGS